MSRRVRIGVMLALVVVVALVVTGCQQTADQASKSAVEAATGVKVDQSGDNVTVTGNDGSSTTMGKALPAGMPSDFPVYPGTVITGNKSTTSEGTSWSYSMETADSVQKVTDWFKAELEKAGWTVGSTFVGGDAGNETSMLICTKGTSELNVTAGTSEGKTTIVAILVMK
ncbi:MAG TPA: hypothetical protein VIJ45_00330 [Coriobacteriia bacterium]